MAQPIRFDFAVTMQEALAWAKARVSVLPDEFYNSLPAQLRSRAFTVSGMATLDQVHGVLDLMNKALANGQTMAQWQAGLSKEALSLGANRLDNIFRTGIQTHYNIGRTIRQRENIANRPYYMWDAINDSRTRPAHRKMDGFIAPMSDPIWHKWSAPAGFRCRCVRITLTEEQAIKRGYRPGQSWPDAQPDEGWAYEKADGQDAALDKLFRQKLGTAHPALAQKAADAIIDATKPTLDNDPMEKIRSFVGEAMKTPNKKIEISLGAVTGIEMIMKETGHDLTGFERILDNYGVRHTIKQHGNVKAETKRGQIAVEPDDFGLIPIIVENPDRVFADGKNKIGRDVIVFTKLIDGIGYRHVEEIRPNGKIVATDSLRKKNGAWAK